MQPGDCFFFKPKHAADYCEGYKNVSDWGKSSLFIVIVICIGFYAFRSSCRSEPKTSSRNRLHLLVSSNERLR